MSVVFAQVPVLMILPPTVNPRFKAEELESLAASIAAVGILEPIVCVRAGEQVRLVAGLRRFTAARSVGVKAVPCLVHDQLTDQQEKAISLVENLHRRSMSPVETGEAFHRLAETGLTQKEVGKMVGVSDFTVSRMIAIATKLCKEARHACHIGEITYTQAFDLTMFGAPTQRHMLSNIRLAKVTRAGTSVDAETGKRRATQRPTSNRGKTETLLRAALQALIAQDRDMALRLTREAVETMEKAIERDGVRNSAA